MPVYRKTRYRAEVEESDGIEFESTQQAWKEATSAAGEILKDLDGSLEPHSEWRMDVSDGYGQALFDTKNRLPARARKAPKIRRGMH